MSPSRHDVYRQQAITRNAGDEGTRDEADRLMEVRRRRELHDLRTVLATPEGRRLLWRLIEFCGVHRSVIDQDSHITYLNGGHQDVGHFIEAEIGVADEESLYRMQREARALLRQEQSQMAGVMSAEDEP